MCVPLLWYTHPSHLTVRLFFLANQGQVARRRLAAAAAVWQPASTQGAASSKHMGHRLYPVQRPSVPHLLCPDDDAGHDIDRTHRYPLVCQCLGSLCLGHGLCQGDLS